MKLWGPHGEFLGSIGSGPQFIMPSDGLIGFLGMLLVPLGILFLIGFGPSLFQACATGWNDSVAEQKATQAVRDNAAALSQVMSGKTKASSGSGAYQPDAKTPSWIINLPNMGYSTGLSLSPKDAIEYATEYYRQWHPEWVCVTTTKNLVTTSDTNGRTYMVYFKLRNPEGSTQKKWRSNFAVLEHVSVYAAMKTLVDEAVEQPVK